MEMWCLILMLEPPWCQLPYAERCSGVRLSLKRVLISEEATSELLMCGGRALGGITGDCSRRSRRVADQAHQPAASPISTQPRTLTSGYRAHIKVMRADAYC